MPEKNSPRKINAQEAVRVACILFELNTKPEALFKLTQGAGLPCKEDTQELLLREWLAFTHAAVLYSLMALAPGNVTLNYLRATRELLARQGYTAAQSEAFIDEAFAAYVEPLMQDKRTECPRVFFERLPNGANAPPKARAAIAAAMAMVLAAILDAWENYIIEQEHSGT